MTALDLGINTDRMNYDAALDVLGQARQPWMVQLRQERIKAKLSAAYLAYCTDRLAALYELEGELDPQDRGTIHNIFNGGLGFPA